MDNDDPHAHDYALGADSREIRRLFDQHRVWRRHVSETWHRAQFRPGHNLLDVGCGPGAATLDLAELAGPSGRAVGVDRSRVFLDALIESASRRGLANVDVILADGTAWIPHERFDGVWCRWVCGAGCRIL